MATIVLFPNLGLGKLDLLYQDGCGDGEIPSWLIDQPEVIAALAILAKAGGTATLATLRPEDDAIVDTATGRVVFEDTFA